MGLVKAALGAASGVMGDQWKEYFYCSALPAEVLAVKGQKKASGRSSNRHGTENVITDEDLARADAAIIAADVKIKQGERFEPIPTLSCKTNEVMTLETALSVVDEVLEAIG